MKQVKGVICFTFTDSDEIYTVDLKNGSGSVYQGKPEKKANLTFTMADQDLARLAAGDLDAQSAFMGGKLKLKGDMGLAMKLGPLLSGLNSGSKL